MRVSTPLGESPPLFRQSGSLLLELVIAMSVITVGLMGFLSSFMTNFRADEDTMRYDSAMAAMENVAEVLRSSAFADVYDSFNYANLEVPDLVDPDGGPASVNVTCFVDETGLPAAFGPILDLDGDGALATADVSAGYDLLPVQLTLSYTAPTGPEVRNLFLILGP